MSVRILWSVNGYLPAYLRISKWQQFWLAKTNFHATKMVIMVLAQTLCIQTDTC